MKTLLTGIWITTLVILFGSCTKDLLKGFNKEALFAPPTQGELDLIKADWQNRDLTPATIVIEQTHAINSRVNLNIVSFQLYGHKQYAGVLVPVTLRSLPVQLYVYGFGLTEPYSYQNFRISPTDTLPFIYVVPALRGQYLNMVVNDTTYKTLVSEGTRNDAFDGAADDAIATLNAVLQIFNADTARVMVRGGSRGGTVALLVAERDKRVKRAVGVAFPTDLLGLTATHTRDDTYQFQFLDALVKGNATVEETRRKMIASSPLYFCELLPKTQIHFGENDTITPAEQGQLLLNAMRSLGLEINLELYTYPGRSHHDIRSNNTELENRIRSFFSPLW
ncbi:MAG TPA: prolyl oligopeptidase family serine peptidase [Chitinophagaceae bacterium]|nr:prolyl oligopeptidase family serine peptidase [Chitinophagaceae bacterium]